MKYYKGIIIEPKYFIKEENILVADDKIINNDSDFFDKFMRLSESERNLIDTYFQNIIHGKNNDIDINKSLAKMYKAKWLYTCNTSAHTEIIYEKIIDEDNNVYAKEIITGEIFPIATIVETENSVNIMHNKQDKCFVSIDDKSNRNAIIVDREDRDISSYFFDKDYNIYHVIDAGYNTYIIEKLPDRKKRFEVIKMGNYKKCPIIFLKLNIKPIVLFSNLDQGNVFITEESFANRNEIEQYQKEYENRFMNKRNYKDFIKKLNDYAKENVFKGDIIPKKEIVHERIEKDEITKIMENIEYLLIRLKDYNPHDYEKYSLEYDNMLSSETLKISITKASLISLEAKIEMSLNFGNNNATNILDYLESKKEEYLNDLANNSIYSSLSITDIDNIMETYLKIQTEYDPISRRRITRNIALLYLFELIENKDHLDNLDLNNSYIKDNLLTILIWIDNLAKKNIIKCDKLLDLSIKYDMNDILEIVKSIEINELDKEKIKKL